MRARLAVVSVVILAFAAGVGVERGRAQAKPRMWADTILDVTTDQLPRRAQVRANLDHWEPGSETTRHTHPGPVVFVLLEGELEEVFADGRTRTLKAGQAYWKPPREEHNVLNRTGKPARALAVHLDPL